MSDIEAESTVAEATITSSDVRAYLQDHSDFFVENSDLLEQLQLPHQTKGAVSLVERQTEVLRQNCQQLRTDIAALKSVALRNEDIFLAFADLSLGLTKASTAKELQSTLFDVLHDKLGIAAVKIHRLEGEDALPEDTRDALKFKFRRQPIYLGRLPKNEKQVIFGDQSSQSVALMMLDQGEINMLIAFGSERADHFGPEMDTLILEQLGYLIQYHMARIA